MSKSKYLKESLKNNIGKSAAELYEEIQKEKGSTAKLLLGLVRGQSKQTHVLRQQKLKVAVLETLLSQKKYLEGRP